MSVISVERLLRAGRAFGRGAHELAKPPVDAVQQVLRSNYREPPPPHPSPEEMALRRRIETLAKNEDGAIRMVGVLAQRDNPDGKIAKSVVAHGGEVPLDTLLAESKATLKDVKGISLLNGLFELRPDRAGTPTLVSPPLVEKKGQTVFDASKAELVR